MAYLILAFFLILFFFLFLSEKIRFARQAKEISYISLQLECILLEDSRNYIRLPSINKATIDLAASANRVLARLYRSQNESEVFQKNMQQVLTDVSHDLKTPLTVVHGYTEILMQKAQNAGLPEDISRLILTLHEKTSGIVHLINQFFSLAKLHSGDMVLHIQEIDAGRLCREILLEYYNLLEEQNFTVDFPKNTAPVYALADEDALRRILKNLIDNAIKYGSAGGYLGLSVLDSCQALSILVTDHGKGISPGDEAQIFSRNYRERKKYGQYPPGSGLGLPIAKKLAEQMHGSLSVSDSPAGGAEFTITLPKVRKK